MTAPAIRTPMTEQPAAAPPSAPRFIAAVITDDGVTAAAEHADHPTAAYDAALTLLERHPDTVGAWQLHPAWPTAVTTVVRLRSGLVGESRRSAHLVDLVPGVWQSAVLTARCDQGLFLPDVEFLRGIGGMPCPRCVRAVADHTTTGERT